MPRSYNELNEKIRTSLSNTQQAKFLQAAMKRGREARRSQLLSLNGGNRLRDEVRLLKTESIANLDSLMREFVENCQKNGAQVRIVQSGSEAIDYITTIARQTRSKYVIKSKSLTTEEIELNHKLLERMPSLQVVETDLGERIIQLANEKPFHLVFPAVHKTQTQVAELFSREAGSTVKDDLSEIMKTVRKLLRPVFLSGQIGITGANVGVAETGTILVEENEGNARLVSAIPDVHIVVMGMEKIVRTWEDALKLAMAHPVSATGTRLTNYVSMISRRLELVDRNERSLHILILDNGRSRMRKDSLFKEALDCIRCGACMNVCPTYGVVGGHVFGYIYPGPIGIPWTEEVHGLERASEFAHLCISCGLCKEICPADIDIPMMIAKVKEKDVIENGQILPNTILSRSDDFSKLASATAPVSNWLIQSRVTRSFMHRFLGIEKRRKLPKFERRTLEKQFVGKGPKENIPGAFAKVAFFPDISSNYNEPARALKALRILQRSNIIVEIPKRLKASGMPYISYGELRKATKIAEHNVSILKDYVEKGYDVVSMEPTAVYCLRDCYRKLLEGLPEALTVSNHSFEYFEYLAKYGTIDRSIGNGKVIGVHIPCHERALSSSKYAIKVLELSGYKVKVIETGTCCGMAGTFGLKKGPLGYDLSMAVGKPLFDLFNEDKEIELVVSESSVCAQQLSDGTNFKVVHPIDLLR